jgi:hypothetical protein
MEEHQIVLSEPVVAAAGRPRPAAAAAVAQYGGATATHAPSPRC